jgi:MFS family permease
VTTPIVSIASLLTGIAVLLMGLGLLATALGVRAAAEGFPDSVTGLVMSAYFGGFILGTFICPGIVRRVGHIRAYAAFAALAAVCAFAHALLVHPLVWGLLRLVTGTSLVGLYLVIESWLNSQTPNEQRGRVLATYMTVTLLALALGQYLLLIDPEAGLATFGVASSLFSLGLVPVALTRLSEPKAVGAPHLGLRHLLAVSPLGVGGALAAGLVTSAFWGMGAVFAKRVGLTGVGIATFMSMTIVGGAVLEWPIGRLSDRFDRRKVLVAVTALSAVAALATSAAAMWASAAIQACAFLFGGLAFSIYSLSVSHLNDRLEPGNSLAASNGVLLVFGVGAILGPTCSGLFMHLVGPAGAFLYMAAVLAAFTAFALLRVALSSPVPEAERSTYLPLNRTSQAALEMDPRGATQVTQPPHQSGAAADRDTGS